MKNSSRNQDVELIMGKDPENRYDERREIGHGAFGSVYYALDKETGEAVAIKVMSFAGKQSSEKWSDIIREIKLLKSLCHKNIVSFKSCYLLKNEQKCWLVMEYCIGSAADILKLHKKPFHESEIAEICFQCLNGLSYLHSSNRIHRDIKAGNILLTEGGIVKLGDLGSASTQSKTQSFVGSAYWMAPEVVMACEYGDYDIRADIWSFGITCIELAEMKPPLLNMNTFSALYHIVQNDPPCLSSYPQMNPWSEHFRSFTEQCLRKDPNQRLSTNACLNHSFITNERPPDLMLQLISRMKKAVYEFDKTQCGKIRMILHLEENLDNERFTEDVDNSSDRSSSKNNTLEKENLNKTVITVNGDSCHVQKEPESSNHVSLHFVDLQTVEIQAKEEINTLRRSKFATLRTAKLIAKEIQEYKAENNLYEQMVGYKRLRQQHHKELKQLEERCKFDNEGLKSKLDKEYEQAFLSCQKEYNRVKTQLQSTLDKKQQENEMLLKKFRKNRVDGQKHALKCYGSCQKREYKLKKEIIKNELRSRNLPKSNFDSALKIEKSKLKNLLEKAEQNYDKEQLTTLVNDTKEFKKHLLHQFHSTEMELINNELNIRRRQIETLQKLLLQHHEIFKEQEFSHFALIETMRKQHLEMQHDMELQNQRECNKRAFEEKRKEHALQSKQQPRELKQKETLIRKQFRQTVKTQSRQFKIYQAQMLQTVPREEQKELLIRLRDEQNRKVAALADLYEETINRMITESLVKLDTQQEEDLRTLKEQLEKDLNLLIDYQSRQKESLRVNIERERVQLHDRINLQRSILDQRITQETTKFVSDRDDRLKVLNDRHNLDLSRAEDNDNPTDFSTTEKL